MDKLSKSKKQIIIVFAVLLIPLLYIVNFHDTSASPKSI